MYENDLACAVARQHFGNTVGEIVRVLLCHPSSLLATLPSRCRPPVSVQDVRDSLAVLLSHGIALAAHTPDGYAYRVRTEPLLLRSRYALYVGLAKRQFGELGMALLRALFQRGRLTASAIFAVAFDPIMEELNLDDAAAEHCLCDMARSGLLRWCGNRREGLFTSDAISSVALAGQSVGQKRPREEMEDADAMLRLVRAGERIRVGRGTSAKTVDVPRRSNSFDVWRISYWYLNRCFRNECCKFVVASRVSDSLAREVLITGLALALDREDEMCPTDDLETSEIETDAVQRQLAENDFAVSERDFWAAIRVLVSLNPECVRAIPEHAPTKLKFIPGRLVAEVRQQSLEDMIVQRYKKAGRRVFRALALEGCMEDKMLAERCMLDIKVVREKLFAMHTDTLISMQEVPRSHEQQRANNWYYLWRVRLQDVYHAFLKMMVKTQTNLMLRLEALEKEQHERRVDADEKENRLREKQHGLLVASIMRVDQSIMVMRDFGPLTAAFFPARYRIIEAPTSRSAR